jgi:transcriptional regulator with XRE-family HTH domain
LAQLSLRQLSALASVSNPYLSQIERGLHEPSVRVVRSIARALGISAEELLERAGLLDDAGTTPAESTARLPDTETAIRNDPNLTNEQREALLSVYRSYRSANAAQR